MEKIFKSKGMTTTEKWVIVFVLTFMCVEIGRAHV